MLRRLLLGLVLFWVLPGCAGSQVGASPRSTLSSLRAAIERNDLDRIYALLPAAARRAETREHFRARMQQERAELQELGEELRRSDEAHRVPSVEVPSRTGTLATVVDDTDGWRVATPGFGPVYAPTVDDAARALRAALEQRNLPALLRVLSDRARGAFLAEMAALIDALREGSSLYRTNTSIQNDSQERRLPDGRSLRFVREGGHWRVENLEN